MAGKYPSAAAGEGTQRYAARSGFGAFYREAQGLTVSGLGMGSYLGAMDEKTDAAYTDAALAAVRGGINFIDTSLNYRHQGSERAIGAAIQRLLESGETSRDEIVLCTKAGYLVPGAVPDGILRSDDIAGGMHCIAPAFLADQIERSRANLGCETIDVFYLHNPETQLSHVSQDAFYRRVRLAFEELEKQVAAGRIRYYGAATWNGFRTKADSAEGLSLVRMESIAREVAGQSHRFRFIQLPVNLAMSEAAAVEREPMNGARVSTLDAAARLGITAIASASLLQGRLAKDLPREIAENLPGTSTDAERAIQFTRSVPGVTVALVGMSNAAHVKQNLAIAKLAPADLSGWFHRLR